jgi:hypothetical protein
MKTYFYAVDKVAGFKVSHVELQFDSETDSHSLSMTFGEEQVTFEVLPEEVAELHGGTFGEHLLFRIKNEMIKKLTVPV